MNQIQEIAIQSVYDGLVGILDGLSFQDSNIAEVSHLADHVSELRTILYDAFPNNIIEPRDDFDDAMDGDLETGLASAGFGVDESYGCSESI
jgi:hypothetical protein